MVRIRRGVGADVPGVLALLDGATEWLVAQGRTDQWGTEPHSTNPRRIEQVRGFVADGGLWIAELDGRAVGALAVGEAMPYVSPATEPEKQGFTRAEQFAVPVSGSEWPGQVLIQRL